MLRGPPQATATDVLPEILRAAGAGSTMTVERYAHLVGGARLAASAAQGVRNAFGHVRGSAER
jgi:hypothetical protein